MILEISKMIATNGFLRGPAGEVTTMV